MNLFEIKVNKIKQIEKLALEIAKDCSLGLCKANIKFEINVNPEMTKAEVNMYFFRIKENEDIVQEATVSLDRK